jgi:hypothetical protein
MSPQIRNGLKALDMRSNLPAWGNAEIAIMLGTTGLAAYVGHETQGLAGAEIAAVVAAFVGTLFAQRKDNLVTVTGDAAEQAWMDGANLVAWIKADDRHAAFFAEALEAAWSTLDHDNLRALSHVLADGFQDDAPDRRRAICGQGAT